MAYWYYMYVTLVKTDMYTVRHARYTDEQHFIKGFGWLLHCALLLLLKLRHGGAGGGRQTKN